MGEGVNAATVKWLRQLADAIEKDERMVVQADYSAGVVDRSFDSWNTTPWRIVAPSGEQTLRVTTVPGCRNG